MEDPLSLPPVWKVPFKASIGTEKLLL